MDIQAMEKQVQFSYIFGAQACYVAPVALSSSRKWFEKQVFLLVVLRLDGL